MGKSCLEKLVLSLFMTGCVILCCSVCARASLTYADDTVISYQLHEGENVTIDCITTEAAYYTALSLHRDPIPLFYLVPNGKKLIQEGQTFTITNLTEQDAGDYGCLVKDKNLQNSTISKAEVVIIVPKPRPLDGTVQEINRTVLETAAVKLSGSKPYIYFKVKSPLRIPVTDKKPFNISVFVKGLQPIKIQWQKDQHELVIGSRYKTFEDDDRRLLVESPFTEEDSGIYSASACNSKGCEVRGVQVMFYKMPNQTFMKQAGDTEQGEGFLGDWVKEYGFFGVPLLLAIVLIFAISYTSGSKKKQEEQEGRKIEGFIDELQELQLQKQRGEGRTASLWSWHSEGESSGDDMPDYDKMKSKKHAKHLHSQDTEHGEYPQMHDYEEDYEGTDGQQHYSDREIIYDREEHRDDHPLHEIDSSDRLNYNTSDAYGLQCHYTKEEVPFTTSDLRHDVAPLDKVPDARITVEEEPAQTMLGSIFGYVQHHVKRIEGVLPTEKSPTQDTQDTIVKKSEATQDTLDYDTRVIQDTVVADTKVKQDTVVSDTKVTQDTFIKEATPAQDTVVKDTKSTQDTAVSDTKATQETAVDHETEQAEGMFGSIIGYVRGQVKRIEGLFYSTEPPPPQVTRAQDTVDSDTQVTQDSIDSDTQVTQDTFANVTQVTQDSVDNDTQVTQDSVDNDTQVTQGMVDSDTQVTQDTVTNDIQEHDLSSYPVLIEFD
ncbi:hypothetical protein ACROYT_G010817 [Oculina patagonica]